MTLSELLALPIRIVAVGAVDGQRAYSTEGPYTTSDHIGVVVTDVPQAEADALMALYYATAGDSWNNNTGWGTDPVVGNWDGITVSGGHVTEINFSSNNLDGTWTSEYVFPYLTGLVSLTIDDNSSLICSFGFSDFPSGMTYLWLHGNSNTINAPLSDLPTSLTYLDFQGNSSTLTGALGDLPSGMTYLKVSSSLSGFTGALADLPSGMTYLYLINTLSTITGALADLPSGMTQLYLTNTTSTITGALSDLPAAMTGLYIWITLTVMSRLVQRQWRR